MCYLGETGPAGGGHTKQVTCTGEVVTFPLPCVHIFELKERESNNAYDILDLTKLKHIVCTLTGGEAC